MSRTQLTRNGLSRSRPLAALLAAVLGVGLGGACGSSESNPNNVAGAPAVMGGSAGTTSEAGRSGGSGAASTTAGASAAGASVAGASVAGAGGSSSLGGAGAAGSSAGSGGAAGSAGTASGSGGSGGSGGAMGTAGVGGGAASVPTSCAAGAEALTKCGKDGNESCCASPLVMGGGPFYRTYQGSGSAVSGTADPATVGSFRLDKFEITVGRFREYVKYLSGASGAPPAAGSGKHTHLNGGQGLADSGMAGTFEPGWDAGWNSRVPSGEGAAALWNTALSCNKYSTWTNDPGENELLPMTCLNWWESYAFCIWDGGFLPSEAEWRYAASGGDEHRLYPWGSTAPGTQNQYAIYDCCYPDNQCRGSGGPECAGFVNAAPVGFASLGAGRYGQVDLSGSVFEWLVDHYGPFASPCTDCAAFTATDPNRVLPGGGYRSSITPYIASSNRSNISYAETFRGDFAVGARCARSP